MTALGFGGRCYEEAGNQMDHFTVEYTFADGAKLFAFSRHMNNCWNAYSDYAHGSKGAAVMMTTWPEPNPKIYKTQNMVPENLLWEYGRRDCNPYHVEWQVLVDAIRNDMPHNEARRAGDADVAGLMGRMACHTGQLITREQAMASNFQFVDNIDDISFDTAAPIHDGPDGIYAAPLPGLTNEL